MYKYALRKLSIGLVSVAIGVATVSVVHADTATSATPTANQPLPPKTADSSSLAMNLTVVPQASDSTTNELGSATTEQNSANLHLTDPSSNQAFSTESKGQIDTQFQVGVNGDINVRLGDLLNRQTVKLADITTYSTSGKYMNFDALAGGFHVNYHDQYVGDLISDYDQSTGNGSITLHSAITDSPFPNLDNNAMLSINLVKVPKLITLNWETDPHRFVPLETDGYFHEVLTLASVNGQKQSYKFLLKPKSFEIEDQPMWTHVISSSDANSAQFQAYYSPLKENTHEDISALNTGTYSDDFMPDEYTFYYLLKPVGNSKLDLSQFSMFVNKLPNAITSKGQMTKENLWINGPDFYQLRNNGVDFKSAGNNLSFGDLTRLNFQGAMWSQQADGSARIVAKVPAKWLKLTKDDYFKLADTTITGVFDNKGEDQDQAAMKKFYSQLNGLPTRFVVGFWLPFTNDPLHHDNKYLLKEINPDGTTKQQAKTQQPDMQVDLKGQTQVNVHLINAYDGSEVTVPLSAIGWADRQQAHFDWTKALPKGFSYGNLVDNQLLNGQFYTLPKDYQLLSVSPDQLAYPASGVTNYLRFVIPAKGHATLTFVNDENQDEQLDTITVDGYFGQPINFSQYNNLLAKYAQRHFTVTGNNFMPGQEIYDGSVNQSFTVHVVHQTQPLVEHQTITRTINVHVPHHDPETIRQTVTLTRKGSQDLVTGVKTWQSWNDGYWDVYQAPNVAGYTATTLTIGKMLVNHDTKDKIVEVTYQPNKQVLNIDYYDLSGQLVDSREVNGYTDLEVAYQLTAPENYILATGQVNKGQFKLQANDDNHLAVTVMPKLVKKVESKKITRTIKIVDDNDGVKYVAQSVTVNRDVEVNLVSGKTSYANWVVDGKNYWEEYVVAGNDQYEAAVVNSMAVTPEMKDITVTVNRHRKPVTLAGHYVDANGKFYETLPDGYVIADGQHEIPGLAMLIVKPQVVPVVTSEYVTRTITLVMPHGYKRVIRQRALKGRQFTKVHLPKLRGYRMTITGGGIGIENADQDLSVTVAFVK